jgi:RNA polymerase sigma-70 factor (ECF subfamily)
MPDPPDFRAVVTEHWDAVYRLLRTLTRDVHETEDLTQETFTRAIAQIGGFKPGTKMRAWLLRIASNAFLDVRRRKTRMRSAPLEYEPAAPEVSPGTSLETAEQCAKVRAVLAELSDLTRLVFHLRVQEEMSFREAAEVAGTTEQAARWHMHHARTRVLERLGGG